MGEQWYWYNGRQQFGPVSREELARLVASGQMQRTDVVWCQGMATWTPANQVQGLLPPADPRFPPPPPQSSPPTWDEWAKQRPGNSSYGNQGDLVHPSNPPKDPLLMGILSGCCIAGLGQMFLGQVIKGVVILIGSMIAAVLTAGVSILVTWPLGGIDAYLVAKKLKAGRSVGQWEFF